MEGYLIALAYASLPALGNFGGGLLAEMMNVSRKALSLALHAAAGIVFAVVGVELLPEALKVKPAWLPVLAFVLGGGFFLLVDQALGIVRARVGDPKAGTAPWMLFFTVAVDLFSDGILIGTGSTLSLSLGLLLALGQVPADIPEGFATIANFKAQGVPRAKRLLLSAAFALPILLGTTFGYWVVRGQPDVYKLVLLAFTAGILTTVTVEEIIPEAHEDGESRFAALVFVGGFALFALISAYFG